MSQERGLPRSELNRRRRAYSAQFGARHPVVFDHVVAAFFGELESAWAEIIPDRVIVPKLRVLHEVAGSDSRQDQEDDTRRLRQKPRFTLYDDREKIGMSVVERRLSAEHARRKRVKWNANDVGRIRTSIENEVAKLELEPGDLEVKLTDIIRVGDIDRRSGGRKLAAIVDQESRAAELFVSEHEVVMNGLGVNLRGFTYPYEQFVPKMTIGRIHRDNEMRPERIDACIVAAQALMPITVTVEPIKFFANEEY